MKKDTTFTIYVEQLRDGKEEKISEKVLPDFLDVFEKDLSFKDPVEIEGKAYLAGDALMLNLNIKAHAIIPCSMCNQPVKVEIKLDNFYHSEPLNEIRTGIFNYKEVLREAILLETPPFAECNQGHCAARHEMKKYLSDSEKSKEEEKYHPFKDL